MLPGAEHGFALFIVTRYAPAMPKSSKRRGGRPRTGRARTAAERMRAYRDRKRAAGLKRPRGWVPAALSNAVPYSDHRRTEARSLAMHCRAAAKISANPALLEIARDNVRRWRANAGEDVPRYLVEWRRILERPWPEIAAVMTGFDDDAIRLRQSSPFAGVLTAEERRQVYEAFRA
jgi:hypothetical protein